ncbi:MAG TPA: hypothetical protein VGO40_07605 [Longimicrobium sp.]|jgi:hypothetical protein|nr:hypothetical protein [Longimicrobium sp.]
MSYAGNPPVASTTEAVIGNAASRVGGGDPPTRGGRGVDSAGEGATYEVEPGMARSLGAPPYERTSNDPLYRPLRIYTVDPGTHQADGATATVNVPYEPLAKGLQGSVFRVMPVFKRPGVEESSEHDDIDLNNPLLLLTDGRAPSPVDPLFHQQMVYAVASLVYASFRRALGRHVGWGFGPHDDDTHGTRLRLRPHGRRGHAGASYDKDAGEIQFGFVRTENDIRGRAAPNGHTFSCVSHDIVTHEVTHALLDGLRAHFLEPTSADVLGFHEGFADVIAVLHRFSYKEVVQAAIRRHCVNVLESELITSLATEFGLTTGFGGAVRRFPATTGSVAAAMVQAANGEPPAAADEKAEGANQGPVAATHRPDMQPHEMGEVFVSAVLDALATVYTQKARRYLRLATGGTGVIPAGDISKDLEEVLADEASQLASQFLDVCIRAIDYCPPVDLQLGEFLRAVITADLDLVPDDAWGYREAWIDAFAQHHIYPRDVQSMSQDALQWELVTDELKVKDLSFTELAFDGDPACGADPVELRRRACALGKFVAKHMDAFGMLSNGDPLLAGDRVTLPQVQSVRSSRRVGPDGQVVFDLVAEVTQTREVEGEFKFYFRGGCTVILGPKGEVRYLIRKSVGQNGRLFRQRKFMRDGGAEFVTLKDGWNVPDAETVQFSHQHGRRPAAGPGGFADAHSPGSGQT